jgi:hypothetical protein
MYVLYVSVCIMSVLNVSVCIMSVLYVLHVLRVPAVVTAPGRRPRGPGPAQRAPDRPQPRHHPSPSCEGYRFGQIRRQSPKNREGGRPDGRDPAPVRTREARCRTSPCDGAVPGRHNCQIHQRIAAFGPGVAETRNVT